MKNIKKVLFIGALTIATLFTISINSNAATVKITGEVVNIRKEASTNSDVVARVSENVECEYIGEKGNWYQIKYKNYTGYVSKDYAKLEGTVSNNTEPTDNSNSTQNNTNQSSNNNQTTATNTEPTVNTINKKFKQNTVIKILPLIHSSNIGNAKTADVVTVLAETSGWTYIQTEEISRMG